MKKLLFESTSCGRCGGSGRYGPTSVYAGKCFKCHGRGEVLTKRGAAAQMFLNDLRKKPASEFKVGDLFYSEGFNAGSYSQPSFFDPVVEIRYDDAGAVTALVGKRMNYGTSPDTLVRFGCTAEQKADFIKQALAYQATLTKMGKVSKKLAKEAA
jgi:hypothetical protein